MRNRKQGISWKAQVKLATGGEAQLDIGAPVYEGDPVVIAESGGFILAIASKAIKELRIVGLVSTLAGAGEGNSFLLRTCAGPRFFSSPLRKIICKAIKQAGATATASDYIALAKYVAKRYNRPKQEEAIAA